MEEKKQLDKMTIGDLIDHQYFVDFLAQQQSHIEILIKTGTYKSNPYFALVKGGYFDPANFKMAFTLVLNHQLDKSKGLRDAIKQIGDTCLRLTYQRIKVEQENEIKNDNKTDN